MLVNYIEWQRIWSERTFGLGKRTRGILQHIRKELLEIEQAPDDLEEWIDVMILALDGAWRAGYSPEQIVAALRSKQEKNFQRVWPKPVSEDLAVEHDRTQ